MTANASLADREACPRGHEQTMWRSRSTRSAWCFACSVISVERREVPATAADAGELVEAWASSGVSAAALELIVRCCGASFRTCRTSSPSLERQLGEGDVQGSAATLHTIKGSASTVGASAGRASELEQALRRADPRRGMEILAGIRLDELRTLCDACLLRLQAMFGDVQAESAS